KNVTVDMINDVMKKATANNESFGYNGDEIVSTDVIGITYGSLFDPTQTEVSTVGDKQLVKVVSWYDNENGFTCQMVRTLKKFASL
ncbi:MAG: type I glyceraldehyde-3-phosphate dehydrogenase, partial [Sphaerochaetaceae bacterium]